jgi:ABC-2 type transport system permease protein
MLRVMLHDWRQLRADYTVVVVALLFTAAIGYAIFAGASRVDSERHALSRYVRSHEALVERYRQRTEAIERLQRGEDPGPFRIHPNEPSWGPTQPAYVAAWAPFFAALPPAPTAALAVGQSDLFPPAYEVRIYERELRPAVEPGGNPLKLLIGHFDLAFVMLYLYPLLIVVLCFDLAASEREQGTLSLILSQPIRLRTLIAAKAGLRALVILGLVLFCSVSGFLAAGMVAGPEVLGRLGLWLAAAALYGGFWFALAIWINSLGKTSTANALMMTCLWLALVLIVPLTVQLAASKLYPVPERAQLVEAARIADQESRERLARLSAKEQSALLASLVSDNPQLQQPHAYNDQGKSAMFATALRHKIAHKLASGYQRLDTQRERQAGFIKVFRVLSPALLMQSLLYDLAGTGPDRQRHFLSEAGRYQREFERFLWPRVFTGARISSAEYKDYPRFEYREEPLVHVRDRSIGPLLTLLALTVLVGMAGFHSFRRFPVN